MLKMFGPKHGNLDEVEAKRALVAISKRFGLSLSWAVDSSPENLYVIHQVITDEKEILGSGMLREEAIKEVYSKCLSTIPVHAQTIGEFRANTLVIPVSEIRDKPDTRREIPHLIVINDPLLFNTKFHSDETALENELGRIFDRGYFPKTIDRKEWIESGVQDLMKPFKNHLIFFTLPGSKNVIFSKTFDTDVAFLFHKNEVSNALNRGDEVPNEVLLDYPDLKKLFTNH